VDRIPNRRFRERVEPDPGLGSVRRIDPPRPRWARRKPPPFRGRDEACLSYPGFDPSCRFPATCWERIHEAVILVFTPAALPQPRHKPLGDQPARCLGNLGLRVAPIRLRCKPLFKVA
jgi:hypothetical protein